MDYNMKNFKYSTQTISKKDIISVNKILKSEFLTQGPKTIEFENKIKLLVGSKYALVTNSASSALLLACKSLSLKEGDLFWTVPNSFVATANCGILSGVIFKVSKPKIIYSFINNLFFYHKTAFSCFLYLQPLLNDMIKSFFH